MIENKGKLRKPKHNSKRMQSIEGRPFSRRILVEPPKRVRTEDILKQFTILPPDKFRKDVPKVKLSRLHKDWKKLGSISHEKQVRTGIFSRFTGRRKDVETHHLKFRLPGVKREQVGKYLYGNILDSMPIQTGLLYDSGIHLKEHPAIKYISQKQAKVDIGLLEKLALDLESCDDPENRKLPEFRKMLKVAKRYYRETKTIPIIVVDVDFERLTESARNSLSIDSNARFHLDYNETKPYRRENLYSYAPILKVTNQKKVELVVDRSFIYTNKKIPSHYMVSIDSSTFKKYKMGESFILEFTDADQEVEVSVALDDSQRDQALTHRSALTYEITVPPYDDTWVPTSLVSASTGESVWIKAYIYHSNIHDHTAGASEIQNPLIILGGFDPENSEDPYVAKMYAQIAAITYPNDFISELRKQFDVILLTYADVCASIEDNAKALAHTLKDIKERNDNRDDMVLLGISMGGLVSRMALCGIENNIFDDIETEHKVKVWVSVDAPHQGAHIPLALQHFVHDVGRIPFVFGDTKETLDMLDSSSAKEMLIEHYSVNGQSSERTEFLQTLDSWGGFPKQVTTTIGVSSGALSYPCPRPAQLRLVSGQTSEASLTTGSAFYAGDHYEVNQGGVNRVMGSSNEMYEPIDNYKGLGSLLIMNLELDLFDFHGLTAELSVWIRTRAKQLLEYLTNYVNYNPDTTIYSRAWYLEIGPNWFIELGLGRTEVSLLPGIPYAVYAGGWQSTPKDVYDALVEQFPSGTGMGLFLPRHCFVPLISALDINTTYLIEHFDTFLFRYHHQMIDTGVLAYWVPHEAVWTGEFSYKYFVDYAALFYPWWFNVWVQCPEGAQFCQLVEMEPFNDSCPLSFDGKVHGQSPFDYVYFHQENKRHGDMDEKANTFIMDKINRTLAGEIPPPEPLPGSPTYAGSVIVDNLALALAGVIGFLCTQCAFNILGFPECNNCNRPMTYVLGKNEFSCTNCGMTASWPTHCGEPMVISTNFFKCSVCDRLSNVPMCDDCNRFMSYNEDTDEFLCASCGMMVPWPTHCGQRMIHSSQL